MTATSTFCGLFLQEAPDGHGDDRVKGRLPKQGAGAALQGAPGAGREGSCSQSAQPGHLLCRKSRGLCWKSAFNLGFLFSAQTGLSFKLFHTSFSKLSSQSKEAGGGEKVG